MDDKKSADRVTDLDGIQVVSKGQRDIVYLAHNRQKVLMLDCGVRGGSRIVVSRHFYLLDEAQLDHVFHTYVKWKRTTHPGFRLPNFSGKTRDGHKHPWSWRNAPNPKKPL